MTPEHASTMKYAFVTTNVCKALERVDHVPLGEDNRRALRKGAELLGELRQGAYWVGGGTTDLGYSASTIPVSSRALNTLSQLKLITQIEDAQGMLQKIAESLEQLAGGATPTVTSDKLHDFFRLLSKRFASEAVEASFGTGLEGRINNGVPSKR